ncbi:histone chaperone asf1 [Penaeus vannamei]|uniref:Putative anti-silencing protein n=2 Tax=Penaeus TaxID=133894 RepID=A0A3R7MLF5_PENVA|nr:histone chaperone asf1-like [Penaeus vannamei]ROT64764.1 putative anti-silencing protein [Penaeus vannamei]
MAKVHIVNVVVLDNPSPFFNPFQFEITFECVEDLQEDLEWKIIYVGSAESEDYDQTLDTVYVGPVPEGKHMFVFQADPPDHSKIPVGDAVGVTVVLLTCGYKGQEFVRVGYYVNNSYTDPELQETPPDVPQFEKLQRNILGTQPRVTKFKIDWDDAKDSENIPPSENAASDGASTSQNSTDLKGVTAMESSNSACAMEVA